MPPAARKKDDKESHRTRIKMPMEADHGRTGSKIAENEIIKVAMIPLSNILIA